MAFTAWRQTVLAIVCSPSRARFTSRPAAFNSSTRSNTKRRGSAALTNGGSASSKNVRSPNSLKPDAEPRQRGQLLAQESGIAGRQLDRLRQQQFLRRRLPVLLEPVQHLLEQNPFVRGVLVKQYESTVGFEHDVKSADDADEPHWDVQQRKSAPEGGSRGPGSRHETERLG